MKKDIFNVRIDNIYIAENGDFIGNGEIFFTFFVDFNSASEVDIWHAIEKADGETISSLYGNRNIEKKSIEKFFVSGFVSEVDDFLSGANDNAGNFLDEYNGKNGWWPGAKVGDILNVAKRLNGDGMDVTLNYSIEYLSSNDLDYPNLNSGIQPVNPNIANGGAILYSGVNYNQNLTPDIGLQINRNKQFIKNGDYDLPTNIHMSSTISKRPFIYVLLGLEANSLSSLHLGQNKKITLYDKQINERHLGQSIEIINDIPYLSILNYVNDENGWNNKTVSIKIEDYYPQPH